MSGKCKMHFANLDEMAYYGLLKKASTKPWLPFCLNQPSVFTVPSRSQKLNDGQILGGLFWGLWVQLGGGSKVVSVHSFNTEYKGFLCTIFFQKGLLPLSCVSSNPGSLSCPLSSGSPRALYMSFHSFTSFQKAGWKEPGSNCCALQRVGTKQFDWCPCCFPRGK